MTADGGAAGLAWETGNYVVGNCMGGGCYGDFGGGLGGQRTAGRLFKIQIFFLGSCRVERFGPEEMEVGEFGCGRELLFLVRSRLFGNLYF